MSNTETFDLYQLPNDEDLNKASGDQWDHAAQLIGQDANSAGGYGFPDPSQSGAIPFESIPDTETLDAKLEPSKTNQTKLTLTQSTLSQPAMKVGDNQNQEADFASSILQKSAGLATDADAISDSKKERQSSLAETSLKAVAELGSSSATAQISFACPENESDDCIQEPIYAPSQNAVPDNGRDKNMDTDAMATNGMASASELQEADQTKQLETLHESEAVFSDIKSESDDGDIAESRENGDEGKGKGAGHTKKQVLTRKASKARSAETEKLYDRYSRSIWKKSVEKRSPYPQHPVVVTPAEVTSDFIESRTTTSDGTWRTYRAGLLWFLAQHRNDNTSFEEAYQALVAVPLSHEGIAKNHNNKPKVKRTIPLHDLYNLLDTLLEMNRHVNWGARTQHWLMAGLYSGLRPREWLGASWLDENKTHLCVPNAKRKMTRPAFELVGAGQSMLTPTEY